MIAIMLHTRQQKGFCGNMDERRIMSEMSEEDKMNKPRLKNAKNKDFEQKIGKERWQYEKNF